MITQGLRKIFIVCVYDAAAASACTVYCAQLGGRVLYCTVVQCLHSTEARCRLCVIQRYWGRVRLREDGAWISWQGWGCCTDCTSLYCTVQRPPLSLELSDWLKQTQVTLQHLCDAAFPDLNLIFFSEAHHECMKDWNSKAKRLYDRLWLWKYSEQTISPPPPVLFECSLKAELILLHSFDAFDIDCRCAALLLQYGYEMMGILGLNVWHVTSARHCAKLTLCSHFISLQTKQRSSVHHKYGIRLSCWCFCPTWS